jgi:hypothetical protein
MVKVSDGGIIANTIHDRISVKNSIVGAFKTTVC